MRLRSAFIALWLVVVTSALYVYFFHRQFLERELQDALSVTSIAAATIYLLLGSVRAFTLIPATALIVAALPFFEPIPLFLLTVAGILISSAVIYWFSETLNLDQYFERKHPVEVARMKAILQRHELPIIVGWAFFPLTPTDVICYVCGAMQVNFKKFMLGILLGEGTISGIYIFLGDYLMRWLPF